MAGVASKVGGLTRAEKFDVLDSHLSTEEAASVPTILVRCAWLPGGFVALDEDVLGKEPHRGAQIGGRGVRVVPVPSTQMCALQRLVKLNNQATVGGPCDSPLFNALVATFAGCNTFISSSVSLEQAAKCVSETQRAHARVMSIRAPTGQLTASSSSTELSPAPTVCTMRVQEMSGLRYSCFVYTLHY